MGALTSKPYAFTARPWELSERESIDIFDPFGSSVKLSLRGGEIIRVLPNVRFTIGDEWISDSSRFSYDSVLAESRSKFIVMSFSSGDDFSQVYFSNLWFNTFFKFRLGYFFVPDHFAISYVNTIQFFLNFSGFSKNLVGSSGFSDNRFFPARQLDSFYKALSGGVTNLFFFNFNIRYLFPTISIRLRQVLSSGRGPSNIFNLSATANNLFGETNLACSPKILVCALRGKSRISRAFFSSNSYSLFDFSTFASLCGYLNLPKIRYSVFHKNPAAASYSEFGVDLSQNRFVSSSHLANSGFLSVLFSTNFPNLKSIAYDAVFPLPHPYEDNYDYYVGGKIVALPAVVSSKLSQFPFSFKLSYYIGFTPSKFMLQSVNFHFISKIQINFSNHITHFFSSQFQVNSMNILLNVKRHNEFRSNYIYYLRSY